MTWFSAKISPDLEFGIRGVGPSVIQTGIRDLGQDFWNWYSLYHQIIYLSLQVNKERPLAETCGKQVTQKALGSEPSFTSIMVHITRRNFTSNFHHDTYPALKGLLKDSDVSNKSVFISGSGTGIGASTAFAFAKSGARAIFLSGRTQATLEETERTISKEFPDVIIGKFVFDISEGPQKAQEVFSKASQLIGGGVVDILVNNAGYLASLPTVQSDCGNPDYEDFEKYWKHFEVNVKGPLSLTASFLAHAPANGAVVINMTSGAAVIDFVPGLSGYGTSKMAALKMFTYLSYEQAHRGLKIFHVHPGIVATAMAKEGNSKCEDTGTWCLLKFRISSYLKLILFSHIAELAADFVVWLNTPEASFLQNRFLYANWDVQELLLRRSEIMDENLLTIGVRGWDSTTMET